MKTAKSVKTTVFFFVLIFNLFNIYTRMAENVEYFGHMEYAIVLFDVCLLTVLLTKAICFLGEKMPALLRRARQSGSFGLLFSKEHGAGDSKNSGRRLSDGVYYVLTMSMLLLLWLPVFLAYYPGIFAYDVDSQLFQQVWGYSTHHPLLHTLYLQFFYDVLPAKLSVTHNTGIACGMVLQMVLFAAMLSYAHLLLRRIRMPFCLRCVLTAVTGVLPFFSMLAVSTTKDTLFAGFICVFVTAVSYEEAFPKQSPGLLNRVLLAVSAAGIILMRNNGIYPLIAFCLALAIFSLKRRQYLLLMLTVCGLTAGLVSNTALKAQMHAETVSINEALSIPYQQMACAYKDHAAEMSEEYREAIQAFIPDVENYYPYNSDGIKFTTTGDASLREFIMLYFRIGCQYPGSYLKGLCKTDAGYICLADSTFSRIYGTENRQGYLLSDTKPGFEIEHRSKFPWLEEVYEKLYTDDEFLQVIGLHILCHPAFYFWILFAMLGYAIIMKKKEAALLLVFTYTLIATILAGPCALIRYALAYIVIVPVLAGVLGRVREEAVGDRGQTCVSSQKENE